MPANELSTITVLSAEVVAYPGALHRDRAVERSDALNPAGDGEAADGERVAVAGLDDRRPAARP